MISVLSRLGLGLVAILALATPFAFSQDASKKKGQPKVVESSLQLLTEMNIVPLTIEVEPFVAWAKPIIDGVEARFRSEKDRRDVSIQIVLRKKGSPEVIVAGRPALSEAETKDLLALIDPAKAPHPKLVALAFRINAKVNGGDPDPDRAFEPKLVAPFEAMVERFSRATTAEQVAMLRGWARDEAIPVLAAAGSSANTKFAGVVNLGKTLSGLDLDKELDVEALTERNHDFWRATLEMAPGNMLTPTVRVALHTAKGEFDKARRFSEIAAFFDANQSAPSRLLGEFRKLHGIFAKGFEEKVNRGIALHDRGKYADAIRVYDEALRDYPASAWANYERFHSRRSVLMEEKKSVDEIHAGWPEARAAILARDPLYATMALASGREEAFQLLRRAAINELFKDASRTPADLLAYADIARDLGQYGYSSLIYWYAFSRFQPRMKMDRELIEDFLYGLEKLGVKDIKDNFRGDHEAAFTRIDADRKKRKEEGPASKFVADPEPDSKPKDAPKPDK